VLQVTSPFLIRRQDPNLHSYLATGRAVSRGIDLTWFEPETRPSRTRYTCRLVTYQSQMVNLSLSNSSLFLDLDLGYFSVDGFSKGLFFSSRRYHHDLEDASSSPSPGINLVLVMATVKDGGLVY